MEKNNQEQASLELCNIVAQGKTLKEAREILATSGDSNKGEQPEPGNSLNAIGLPMGSPDTIEGLFAAFSEAGKDQHPNSKLEKLVKLYSKTFLS